LWRAIAKELSRPRRNLRAVNLSKISKYTKPGEWVIVPGKVLANGELSHKVNIVALSFSKTALEKIGQSGKAVPLHEFIKQKGTKQPLRIIG
ncbi:50S ribosomal protein L18e, partial [Candidatus Woesearchaeota archaeon]